MAKKDDNHSLDFGAILREYAQKWWLFLICIVVCVGLGYAYIKLKSPAYEVKANILISQEETAPSPASLMANFTSLGSLFGSSSPVDDEIFLVSSHTVLRDVVKRMDLNKVHYVKDNILKKTFRYKDFPIDVTTIAGLADTLRTDVDFKVMVDKNGSVEVKTEAGDTKYPTLKAKGFPITVKTDYGTFVLNKTKYLPTGEDVTSYITFQGYDNAAENLSMDITIGVADKKANAIGLSMISTDIDFAKDIINTIIKRYNERGIEDKRAKNQKTANFLDTRLSLLTDDLAKAESEIEKFKKDNGVTDIMADAQYQLEKRGGIETQLIQAQTNLEIINVTSDFIADPENAYSLVPMTTVTADAADAITAYNEMVLKRIEMAQTAHGNNATLKSLDKQLDAMRDNINVSLKKARQSAQAAVREIESKQRESDGYVASVPALERTYRNIERQRTIKEQLYVYLLERREETAMMLANAVEKGTIIDEAYPINEPVGIKPKMMLAAIFILSLFLAPAILYVRSLFRNKFSTRQELEKLTDVPVLGEICTARKGEHLSVTPGSNSAITELFRMMRTNLQFVLSSKDNKVILVTSAGVDDGKTFIATNLASTLAIDGKRALLVGLDIRHPKIAEYLEMNDATGMTEYLSNSDLSLNDIILKNPLDNGLDIVLAGAVPPNPGELLNSERLDDFFAQVRDLYDYIIIDSAPLGKVSDTYTLIRVTDATIFVCRAKHTTHKDIELVNDLYDSKRLPRLTLAVNGVKTKKDAYGYGN